MATPMKKPVNPTSTEAEAGAGVETERHRYTYTDHIKLLGVGTSETNSRFLRVGVGGRTALVSVKQLVCKAKEELARLEEVGAPLILPAAQAEFLKRAHDEAGKGPTFRVATRVGLFDDVVVFPDGPVPRSADIEMYLDERQGDVHRKFRRAGTGEGWGKLLDLCEGNTRVICGFGLAFSGLPCAAFGLDPPALQYVGPGGCGKTPAARIVSSVFGWDSSSRLGFGSSWNTKPNALDVIGAGCNNTLLFLDEMSQAKSASVEAVMRLMQGQGMGRYTELQRLVWCDPLLSTSNVSLLSHMRRLDVSVDLAAYIDRLPDVPPPDGCDCYFECLHGSRDVGGYCARLDALAEKNHGWVGRAYASRFVRELRSDREGLREIFFARREQYMRRAADAIEAPGRDLTRLHGRFATMYASGRLAMEFGLFPVAMLDFLDAVQTCERDHVAFVARELGAAAATTRAPGERLERYLQANASRFIDVPRLKGDLPRDHDHERCLGYIGAHDGCEEHWIPNGCFEKVAGGRPEATRLKEELHRQGRIATQRRGDALSLVVKRFVPGLNRVYVVALKRRR